MIKLRLSFLILILISSCTLKIEDSIIVDGKAIELNQFSSKGNELTILYPKDWVLVTPFNSLVMIAKDPNISELNVIDLSVLQRNVNESNTFSNIVDFELEEMSTVFQEFKVNKIEDMKVSGLDYKVVSCVYSDEEILLRSYLCYIKKEGAVYNLGLTSRTRDFDKYSELYHKIIKESTFR